METHSLGTRGPCGPNVSFTPSPQQNISESLRVFAQSGSHQRWLPTCPHSGVLGLRLQAELG